MSGAYAVGTLLGATAVPFTGRMMAVAVLAVVAPVPAASDQAAAGPPELTRG